MPNKIYGILVLILLNASFINNQNTNEKPGQNEGPNPNENVNEPEEQKTEGMILMEQFSNEWEAKMRDFIMDYTYYIPLEYRDQEMYFENVTTVPTVFKGTYFIADESTDQVEFYIRDSFDRVIYQHAGHYNIFEIPLKKPDRYAIIFRNNLAKHKVVVTFSMNTGQNNLINSNDLTNTEKKMDHLEAVIKKFNMEFKLSRDIHIKRYQSKL